MWSPGPVVIDLAVPADPAFVAHDRSGCDGLVGGRAYRATTPMAPAVSLPRRTTRLALQKQIAAGLLPEASDSWAVEDEQGL
jgi:hypothetical protein